MKFLSLGLSDVGSGGAAGVATHLTSEFARNSIEAVARQILLVELDGPDAVTAAQRLEAAVPDAVAWGAVNPCDAAVLVFDAALDAA